MTGEDDEDEELGPPIEELALLEEEPSVADFVERLSARIDRTRLSADLLTMLWVAPREFIKEMVEVAVELATLPSDGGEDE